MTKLEIPSSIATLPWLIVILWVMVHDSYLVSERCCQWKTIRTWKMNILIVVFLQLNLFRSDLLKNWWAVTSAAVIGPLECQWAPFRVLHWIIQDRKEVKSWVPVRNIMMIHRACLQVLVQVQVVTSDCPLYFVETSMNYNFPPPR